MRYSFKAVASAGLLLWLSLQSLAAAAADAEKTPITVFAAASPMLLEVRVK